MTADSQAEREAALAKFQARASVLPYAWGDEEREQELRGEQALGYRSGWDDARAAGRAELEEMAVAFLDVLARGCRCDALRGVTCIPHERYFGLADKARALLPSPESSERHAGTR